MIWQMIEDWFRGILTDGILSNLSGLCLLYTSLLRPEVLTDEDVMDILKQAFSQSGMKMCIRDRYMSTRPAIVKPDEPFDIYEIDLSDEDAAAE